MDGSGQWTAYGYSGSGLEDNTSTAAMRICNQEDGFTLSLSTKTANVLRYIQITYYLTCFVIAFSFNVFVIFITARFKKLHNITFYLALQLVIADLANTILFYPASTINAIANRFVFTGLCPLLGYLLTFLFTARNLLMFVLVADRFFLIFLPFWYARHRVKVVISLSIGAWMLAFVITAIPAIALTDCYSFQLVTWTCVLGASCDFNQACVSYTTFRTTTINIGMFIAFLLYSALLCRARKLKNKVTISHSNESAESRAAAKIARKREQRANTTFLIMFITLVGVTLPPIIVFQVSTALNLSPTLPPSIVIIGIVCGNFFYLIFIMDPIVIMRNQDVREVLQTIVAKLRRRRDNSQNN